MTVSPTYRIERITRLLEELRYEIERGLSDNEIEEEIDYRFIFPISRKIPDGVVRAEFITRPVPRNYTFLDIHENPRLTLVGGKK